MQRRRRDGTARSAGADGDGSGPCEDAEDIVQEILPPHLWIVGSSLRCRDPRQAVLAHLDGGSGIAWASILSMPYAILSGSLLPEKTGTYMGVFNFFITLPEIIASLAFGWIMNRLLGNIACLR